MELDELVIEWLGVLVVVLAFVLLSVPVRFSPRQSTDAASGPTSTSGQNRPFATTQVTGLCCHDDAAQLVALFRYHGNHCGGCVPHNNCLLFEEDFV